MIIFLNGLITVSDGPLWNCIHVIGIIKAIVTVIVANGGDNHGKDVELRKGGIPDHFAFSHDMVRHLKHISSVDVIMILNFANISFVDFVQKSKEDLLIDLSDFIETEFLHEVNGYHWKSILASDLCENSMSIEIEFTSFSKVFFKLIQANDMVKLCTYAWFFTAYRDSIWRRLRVSLLLLVKTLANGRFSKAF